MPPPGPKILTFLSLERPNSGIETPPPLEFDGLFLGCLLDGLLGGVMGSAGPQLRCPKMSAVKPGNVDATKEVFGI